MGALVLEPMLILTEQKAVEAAVRALNDKTRRQILHALRARTMSTTELCEFLRRETPKKEVKPQTVRYHLKLLEEGGLITQDGYAPAGNGGSHIMQKLWRATAEAIFIASGSLRELPERVPAEIEQSLDLMETMRTLGFHIPNDEDMTSLAQDFTERDMIWRKGRERAVRVLEEAAQIDPSLYITLSRIISVITLNNTDYERYWELSRDVTDRFRKAFQNGTGKNPEVY